MIGQDIDYRFRESDSKESHKFPGNDFLGGGTVDCGVMGPQLAHNECQPSRSVSESELSFQPAKRRRCQQPMNRWSLDGNAASTFLPRLQFDRLSPTGLHQWLQRLASATDPTGGYDAWRNISVEAIRNLPSGTTLQQVEGARLHDLESDPLACFQGMASDSLPSHFLSPILSHGSTEVLDTALPADITHELDLPAAFTWPDSAVTISNQQGRMSSSSGSSSTYVSDLLNPLPTSHSELASSFDPTASRRRRNVQGTRGTDWTPRVSDPPQGSPSDPSATATGSHLIDVSDQQSLERICSSVFNHLRGTVAAVGAVPNLVLDELNYSSAESGLQMDNEQGCVKPESDNSTDHSTKVRSPDPDAVLSFVTNASDGKDDISRSSIASWLAGLHSSWAIDTRGFSDSTAAADSDDKVLQDITRDDASFSNYACDYLPLAQRTLQEDSLMTSLDKSSSEASTVESIQQSLPVDSATSLATLGDALARAVRHSQDLFASAPPKAKGSPPCPTSGFPADPSESTERPSTPTPSDGPLIGKSELESVRSRSPGKFTDSSEEGYSEDAFWCKRPDIDDDCLEYLCDLTKFTKEEKQVKLLTDYREGINFALGEGGRELLRACLNAKGCKGRRLQGAAVPTLLRLAKDWGLWNVALRIRVERTTGQLCPKHEAFVRFKAMQSQMRKFIKREPMHTERDVTGRITDIRFEEMKSLTLGKEGREKLRIQLRRLHDKDPVQMEGLLNQYGFRYSELRNATVPQLLKMAHICCMWDEVIDACKQQEAKRDGKSAKRSKKRHAVASGESASQLLSPAGSSGSESPSFVPCNGGSPLNEPEQGRLPLAPADCASGLTSQTSDVSSWPESLNEELELKGDTECPESKIFQLPGQQIASY